MSKMSVEYLAGFFDGEGCITTTNGQWEINCTQTEKNGTEALMEMQRRWGGSLYVTQPLRENHSPAWRWKARGIEAAIALTDMYLFLTVKLPKAQEALESLASRSKIRRILGRIGEPEHPYYSVGD